MSASRKKQKPVSLIWITGLPGSGKTTFAQALYDALKDTRPCIVTDGDAVREIMGRDLGYNTKDRLSNAYRIARLNKYLLDHGLTVICATVSLFKEIHEWNRAHIPHLVEVYIETPMELLIVRDQKGMYSRAVRGTQKNVRGFDQSFDAPERPDFIIKNDRDMEAFLKHIPAIIRALKLT